MNDAEKEGKDADKINQICEFLGVQKDKVAKI